MNILRRLRPMLCLGREHNFVTDWTAKNLNGVCSRCGTRLKGNLGAHSVWWHLSPEERKRIFGRDDVSH